MFSGKPRIYPPRSGEPPVIKRGMRRFHHEGWCGSKERGLTFGRGLAGPEHVLEEVAARVFRYVADAAATEQRHGVKLLRDCLRELCQARGWCGLLGGCQECSWGLATPSCGWGDQETA